MQIENFPELVTPYVAAGSAPKDDCSCTTRQKVGAVYIAVTGGTLIAGGLTSNTIAMATLLAFGGTLSLVAICAIGLSACCSKTA